MVVGSVLAVVQTDVKRMLAYSSINHAGFVLVAVQAASERGVEAALFYLAAYTCMVAGSFGVVTVVSRKGDIGNSLDDYRGLSRDRPVLALAFALFLFAQAGVPLTSGFFAKFYVITAAIDAGSTWLAVIAMLTAVVAAFLYLRIIVSMYMSVEDAGEPRTIPVPFAAGAGPRRLPDRHPRRRALPRAPCPTSPRTPPPPSSSSPPRPPHRPRSRRPRPLARPIARRPEVEPERVRCNGSGSASVEGAWLALDPPALGVAR